MEGPSAPGRASELGPAAPDPLQTPGNGSLPLLPDHDEDNSVDLVVNDPIAKPPSLSRPSPTIAASTPLPYTTPRSSPLHHAASPDPAASHAQDPTAIEAPAESHSTMLQSSPSRQPSSLALIHNLKPSSLGEDDAQSSSRPSSSSPLSSDNDGKDEDELMSAPPYNSVQLANESTDSDGEGSFFRSKHREHGPDGRFAGFDWNTAHLDSLFDIVAPEVDAATGKLQPGAWQRIYARWRLVLKERGIDPPSINAVVTKVYRLREVSSSRWGKLLHSRGRSGMGTRCLKRTLDSTDSPSSTESASSAESEFHHHAARHPAQSPATAGLSKPSSLSTAPAGPAEKFAKVYGPVEWSRAEVRLLIKLFKRAHARGETSQAAATTYVAKKWMKVVDGKQYRPRTASSLKKKIQRISCSEASFLHAEAKEIRDKLLDKTVWNAGKRGYGSQQRSKKLRLTAAQDSDASSESEDIEEIKAASPSPRSEAFGAGGGWKRGGEDGGGNLKHPAASHLRRLASRASPLGTKAGMPSHHISRKSSGYCRSHYQPDAAAHRSAQPSSTWKQGTVNNLSRISAHIGKIESSQHTLNSVSVEATEELRLERFELKLQAQRTMQRVMDLPASVSAVVDAQQRLGKTLGEISRRVRALESKRETRRSEKEEEVRRREEREREEKRRADEKREVRRREDKELEAKKREEREQKRREVEERQVRSSPQQDRASAEGKKPGLEAGERDSKELQNRLPPVHVDERPTAQTARQDWRGVPTGPRGWGLKGPPPSQRWRSHVREVSSSSHAARFGGRYDIGAPVPPPRFPPHANYRAPYARPDYGPVPFLPMTMPHQDPRHGPRN